MGSRSASIDSAMMRRRRREGDGPDPLRRLRALGDAPMDPMMRGQLIGQEMVIATEAIAVPVSETAFSTPLRPTRIVKERLERSVPRLPQSLGPKPLFTEKQVAEMEQLQKRSTLLPVSREDQAEVAPETRDRGRSFEKVYRGANVSEDAKPATRDRGRGSMDGGMANGYDGHSDAQFFHVGDDSEERRAAEADEAMWRWNVSNQMKEMSLLLRATREENSQLRQELHAMKTESGEPGEAPFQTPEEEEKTSRGLLRDRDEPSGLHRGHPQERPRPAGLPRGEEHGTKEAKKPQSGASFPPPGAGPDAQMQFMCLMLQSVQEMHKQLMDQDRTKEKDTVNGEELIRTGISELPMLPEWDATEAPLRMGDWLTVLGPMIADLSSTAEEWWTLMLKEVGDWYQFHLSLSPLDRTSHLPETPVALQDRRWRRLERRVAGLLLKAVPESQREDLIAKKYMTVFGILTSLQISYQPGGFGEKRTLLKNLEEPAEASTSNEAVVSLRKWIRWRQRTEEIHAIEPDPTVLMKGLTRLVHRVLDNHQELQFRISLARSSLLVDSTPTRDSVTRYATHLLAELEQVAYTERKGKNTKDGPKVKRLEEEAKGLGKGGDRKIREVKKEGDDAEKGKPICKFFNTEQGCRKGRQCKWLHQPDEKRRCFACGSTKHMAPACPTAVDSPPRTKVFREGAEVPQGGQTTQSTPSQDADTSSDSGSVKTLIEEATQMLKSMSQKTEVGRATKPSLEDLQRQLNELRGETGSGSKLKTFRLTKMAPEGVDEMALLDSGATHPLRSLVPGDDLAEGQKVWVALADGHRVPMLMTPAGIMLSVDQKVEPIIPLGWLADRGCRITWTEKGLQVNHPLRGALPVSVHAGSNVLRRWHESRRWLPRRPMRRTFWSTSG